MKKSTHHARSARTPQNSGNLAIGYQSARRNLANQVDGLLTEIHGSLHGSRFLDASNGPSKVPDLGKSNFLSMKLVEDLTNDPAGLSGANISKFFQHLGNFDWNHIKATRYKDEEGSWKGVSRRVFTGETGESPQFHVRYFEIDKDGYSTLEHHQHEHVVVVMRGQGHAIVGERRLELKFGDVLYVAPNEIHQFSNGKEEPFGFLCIVNADRDRPVPVELGAESSCR